MRIHSSLAAALAIGASSFLILTGFAQTALAEASEVGGRPGTMQFANLSNFENDDWVALPAPNTVDHCSGYGCRERQKFTFSGSDILQLAIIMSSALEDPTPEAERKAVAEAGSGSL